MAYNTKISHLMFHASSSSSFDEKPIFSYLYQSTVSHAIINGFFSAVGDLLRTQTINSQPFTLMAGMISGVSQRGFPVTLHALPVAHD